MKSMGDGNVALGNVRHPQFRNPKSYPWIGGASRAEFDVVRFLVRPGTQIGAEPVSESGDTAPARGSSHDPLLATGVGAGCWWVAGAGEFPGTGL
jgi:hypothetical protein